MIELASASPQLVNATAAISTTTKQNVLGVLADAGSSFGILLVAGFFLSMIIMLIRNKELK